MCSGHCDVTSSISPVCVVLAMHTQISNAHTGIYVCMYIFGIV